MEITAAAVREMASGLAGIEVDEAAAGMWLERVAGRCSPCADSASLLLASARYAAADAIECDGGYASRMSAGGLSLGGRSAGEAAAALRRSAARAISPYLTGVKGVVRA